MRVEMRNERERIIQLTHLYVDTGFWVPRTWLREWRNSETESELRSLNPNICADIICPHNQLTPLSDNRVLVNQQVRTTLSFCCVPSL
jgi:hypothetical protein